MKLTVSVLLALTGTAAAESVTLSSVPSSTAPHIVGSEAVCKDGSDRLRVTRTKFAGHEVAVLHECGASDMRTELAFELKDGDWRTYSSGTIAYQAGNMTEAPLNITLLGETTTTAKLKGKPALLHRVDTSHRAIHMADGTVESETHMSRIDVCTYAKDGAPSCGYAEVECPETGCQAPTIVKGALWLHAKGGRKRFPID